MLNRIYDGLHMVQKWSVCIKGTVRKHFNLYHNDQIIIEWKQVQSHMLQIEEKLHTIWWEFIGTLTQKAFAEHHPTWVICPIR